MLIENSMDEKPVEKFTITLDAGFTVKCVFCRGVFSGEITDNDGKKYKYKTHHFEFYGSAISSSGYRSYFTQINEPVDDPKEYAKEVCELLLKEELKNKPHTRRTQIVDEEVTQASLF